MSRVRRPLALLVTVLVSLPNLMAVGRGEADAASAGVRFVVALGLIWLGFAVLDRVVTAYAATDPADERGEEPART